MRSNSYKKKNHKGEKLSEEIGKGINEEHLKKVLRERRYDETISFKLPKKDKELFTESCINQSEILRSFIKSFINK